jgi:FdrA protein
MLIVQELVDFKGVVDASVVMGTEANKAILKQADLLTDEADEAGPNDLILVVKAEQSSTAEDALSEAERLLSQKVAPTETAGKTGYRSVRSALRSNPEINMVVVSVAGQYAAAPVWDALLADKHVLIFSDHVSVEDERSFKTYGRDHGLLVMGPGAGTAIINGVGLGFANAVPRGPVGIVSAAGTGLQEVSSLLARAGVGTSQAIGTGGRDVTDAIGGITMLQGLEALQADPATKVILIVSKLASVKVINQVVARVRKSDKPTVLAIMGASSDVFDLPDTAYQARTLHEAAEYAAALVRGDSIESVTDKLQEHWKELETRAQELRSGLSGTQRYLRGLYSGGTLCEETMHLWSETLGGIWSNAPLDNAYLLPDPTVSHENSAIDLGEEEFTSGRPHPMIDNRLRVRRLLQEGSDPEVAVLLLDVVLGYGVHPDPAAELGPAIVKARTKASDSGRNLIVLASVTGTEGDPQGFSRQSYELEKAGAIVMGSNADAARLAQLIVQDRRKD